MKKYLPLPLLPWLAVAAALAAYLPAVLFLDYVWDDVQLFVNNPTLRIAELTWAGIMQPILPGTSYFRPLPLATMAAEFLGVGVDPQLSHIVNLGLHAVNTLLVGLVALHLTRALALENPGIRIILAGLFYAVHPALIEPVAWVSGRFDLLVTTFMLFSIWAYVALKGKLRTLCVALGFFLAALSKEMAVVLPLMLVLVHLALRARQAQSWGVEWKDFWRGGEWRLYAVLVATGLLYIALRAHYMGRLLHEDNIVDNLLHGFVHRTAFVGQTLLFYFEMALWPFANLGPQHPLNPLAMSDLSYATGVLTVVVTACAAIAAIFLRRPAALLAAGFVLSLAPVLNIVPLTIGGNVGHERFLTFPLAMLVMALALVPAPATARLSPGMRRIMPLLAGGIAVFWLGWATLNVRLTVPLWKNDLTLWSWAYARYPDYRPVRFAYAAAATRFNDLDRAGEVLEKVVMPTDQPRDFNEVFLLALKGHYLSRRNRPAEAIPYFQMSERLLTLIPGMRLTHQGILERGEPLVASRPELENPNLWFLQFLYAGMAEASLSLRAFGPALQNAEISLFYSPKYPSALMSKAFALYGLDRPAEGDQAFELAMEFFVSNIGDDARKLRSQFLAQLCSPVEGRPGKTCSTLAPAAGREAPRPKQGVVPAAPDPRGISIPPA
ncbi:MAG TPA: hypothetical protein VGE22_04655 [Solimonas sp.]